MALQLRRKTHESIVYIDSDSAPRIMPSGEDFILEDLPVGTRVIYPNQPVKGLPNQNTINFSVLGAALLCGILLAFHPGYYVLFPLLILLGLVFGLCLVLPIGG